MLTVGLTGNVASGKSSVAQLWSEAGVPVVRADDLARQVVAPGSPGLGRVVQEFGADLLEPDGSLNREALREEAFRSPERLQALERILHPLIREERDRWLATQEEAGTLLAVAEVPLLFEAGLQEDFDAVVLVVAREEERLRRLVEIRGWTEEESARVMGAQMPEREKVSRADFILDNHGSLQDLEVRAMALLDLLRARSRRDGRR